MMLHASFAKAQTGSVPNQAENTGQDAFRPPANLFQLLYGYQTAPGSGGSTVTTDRLNFRFDHRIDLSPQSLLVLRTDLPLLAKNPMNSSNPSGDYLYGIGDADAQATYVYNFNQRWAGGAGLRLIAPTGDDVIGSGKWQFMPVAGFRYGLPDFASGSFLEPFARYDVSFAGNPGARNISNLQFAPYLNIGLPDNWFIAFFPNSDIRINFGDPINGQTGRLFLPLDVRIGHDLTNHIALSLEVGVPIISAYPVYKFKAQVRLNATF
ncbi:MAG: hypothetical protein KGK33_13580 [Hyphomicrobiales bacterium]|nr:hypothetical protein [Hyphomicrobiales bacterium]